jgi:hypothetical protein
MTRSAWTIGGVAIGLLAAIAPERVDAAGPLIVLDGKAVKWAGRDVRGGPLSTTTVTVDGDGRRTVHYRVDAGPLGPLAPADAVRLADRLFEQYSSIPTASIEFHNAGPILDPDSGLPMDVDGSNFGKVLSSFQNTFQNPIVFDSDGSITGPGGILGLFDFLALEPDGSAVTEACVVLNGAILDAGFLSTTSFIGVFQHEFGHFAGPLDHAQVNGGIADPRNLRAAMPAGFDKPRAFDLFAPFTETVYPFLSEAPEGSTVGFPDTGFFIATLDLDTRNSLSNLYPTPAYKLTRGSIEGSVFLRSGREKVPIPGMNVIARRVQGGPYPPPPDTLAYPEPPEIDGDGVPAAPPPRSETDSLATASSAVTGVDFGYGGYRIQGLPPGLYEVMLQEINPRSAFGSSIGSRAFPVHLPFRETYFHLPRTSVDVNTFTPVPALPLLTTPRVDLEILGLDTSEPRRLSEADTHFAFPNAQDLGPLPALVTGRAALTDPFQVRVDFGFGDFLPVHDLYRFQTTRAATVVFVTLEPQKDVGDLDLYLFRPPPSSCLVPGSPCDIPMGFPIPRYSIKASSREMFGIALPPGTWYLGVSAVDGNVKYRLRVVPEAE